ncbi:MAG: GNAT family N-acetyltransferase [Vicingaceae bacterium]|nr:GNAT family N-acetyltransferase [Vicingaceae bacterium]
MNPMNDIANNLYHFYDALSKNLDENSGKNQTISWVKNKPGFWPNLIYNTQFNETNMENAVFEIVEQQKSKQLPPFLVVPNNTIGLKSRNYLTKNGLREINQWAGMVLELTKFHLKTDKNQYLKINLISTKTELEPWVKLISEELFTSQKVESSLFFNLLQHPNFKFYGAYLNNELVGTLLSFYTEKNCGLYLGVTKNAYRKQGIMTELFNYAINQAKKNESVTVVIQASKMGESVYKKIGFEKVGTFSIYWKIG